VIGDAIAGARATESCAPSTTSTTTASTTTSTSLPASAGVRLLQYGPAHAIANAFALTVLQEQYEACFAEEPPDPDAPPLAITAVCAAQATNEFGDTGSASATASLTVSSTPAGVDGQGNPLISAVSVTASTDSTAAGQGAATTSSNVRATFLLTAPAGMSIVSDVDVAGPASNDDPCEVTPIPGTFDASGTLTLVVSCPDDRTRASFNFPGPETSTRSITVSLTFGGLATTTR
jgi:hypothetical protein